MKRILLALAALAGLQAQTAKFPNSVVTLQDLGTTKDATTPSPTLTDDVTDSTLTWPVSDGSKFVAYQIIQCGNELVQVCSIDSNTLTLCTSSRGFGGTSAASHGSGATIRMPLTSYQVSALQNELIAIAGNVAPFRSATSCTGACVANKELCLRTTDSTIHRCDSGGSTWTQVSGASANANAYYVVSRSTDAPTNAVNLGGLSTGLLKMSVTGGVATLSTATSASDYAPATSGSAILKGNGSGGFSSTSAGTDYAPATSGSVPLKGNGAGGFSSAGYSDIVGLWTTCSGFLKNDGTCSSATTSPPGSTGQLAYNNASSWGGATVGNGLSLSGGVLSVAAPVVQTDQDAAFTGDNQYSSKCTANSTGVTIRRFAKTVSDGCQIVAATTDEVIGVATATIASGTATVIESGRVSVDFATISGDDATYGHYAGMDSSGKATDLGTSPAGAVGIIESTGESPQLIRILPNLRRGRMRMIPFAFGDGGTELTGGTAYVRIGFACTLVSWSITVDAGTATVKTWKRATGTAAPTVSDSISTSGVSISSGSHVYSTTLTDFTSTAIAENDVIAANITAIATAKSLTFTLGCVEK